MTDRSGHAPVDGTALFYEVAGAGEPLVLLHGFALDRRMWDPQMEAFTDRFRVVRYDLRGFGLSLPGTGPYSHADDLDALLRHLGVGTISLVGLSMGGGAALNYAVSRPDRVRNLVVADPSLGGYRWSAEWSAAMRALPAIAAGQGVAAARDAWLAFPIFTRALANERAAPMLRRLVGEYPGWYWTRPDTSRALAPPAVDRLDEIQARTLVIVGEHDVADFQTIADTIARHVADAVKVSLPEVGHMVNLEAPDRFNEVVLRFLDE